MRMHFWLDVARVKGRVSLPVKTSLKGTMPAFANMSVGSFAGMRGALAQTSWPLPRKNSRNVERTSEAVFMVRGVRSSTIRGNSWRALAEFSGGEELVVEGVVAGCDDA